jgi:hypothetical protein
VTPAGRGALLRRSDLDYNDPEDRPTKQLQRGARPRIETAALKAATIAQQEVLSGVIEFSYGPFPEEMQGEAEVGELTTETYTEQGEVLSSPEHDV